MYCMYCTCEEWLARLLHGPGGELVSSPSSFYLRELKGLQLLNVSILLAQGGHSIPIFRKWAWHINVLLLSTESL